MIRLSIAATMALQLAGQATAQEPPAPEPVVIKVAWSGESTRPSRLGAGPTDSHVVQEPTRPSMTSWEKEVAIASDGGAKIVQLHIGYGQNPLRANLRLSPTKSGMQLVLHSRRADCNYDTARNLNDARKANKGEDQILLGVIFSSARALNDWCTGASRTTKRNFKRVLEYALRDYARLDGSVDILHFAQLLDAPSSIMNAIKMRNNITFANNAIEEVVAVLNDEDDREMQAKSVAALLQLAETDELAGAFSQAMKSTQYEAHLIAYEFDAANEVLVSAAEGDAASRSEFAKRIERLDAMAAAPAGSDVAEAFVLSKVKQSDVELLTRRASALGVPPVGTGPGNSSSGAAALDNIVIEAASLPND